MKKKILSILLLSLILLICGCASSNDDTKKSSDTTLKSLQINVGTLKDYAATVENNVDKVKIMAEASNSKATVTGTGEFSLKVGNNDFKITVKAEDGTTKDYTVTITRKEAAVIPVVVDKKNLESALKGAQVKYDAAVEGTEVGKYKLGSKDPLKAAIAAANLTFASDKATQTEVDNAVKTLNDAVTLFDSLKITTAPVANKLTLHYFRYDGKYDGWGLHLWVRDKNNKDTGITTWDKPILFDKTDSYGKYVDLDIPDLSDGKKWFYIIHKVGGAQTADLTFPDLTNNKEFWAMELEKVLYTSKPDTNAKITSAEIVAIDKIVVKAAGTLIIEKDKIELKDNTGKVLPVTSVSGSNITATLDLGKSYTLKYGTVTLNVTIAASLIDTMFEYTGNDLGATYNAGNVSFKLWAPTASKVIINIYDKANQDNKIVTKELAKEDKGVWSLSLDKKDVNGATDLDGYFYEYEVTVNGDTKKALDPYAKSLAQFDSSTGGIGKAAIINPATQIKVNSYANIDGYTAREKSIIYEVHVRDFTSDPNLKTTAKFGTYKSFIEKIQYLKELGVTHVQLLPVYAYYYGDESKRDTRETNYSASNNNYNWGYDPHSYFAPEGMYSENPTDPKLRVNELRELINAIHSAGMGVILDVVYNHTAKTDILENIVPGYYYRMDNGTFVSKSGCGNDVASTQKMSRKLILDSIKYWVEEYKVDGFRFDLMGIIDTETMTMGVNEAKKSNPNTLFIGEGWTGMYTGPAGTIGATQGWMGNTNDIAVFSDGFRDVFKMGGMHEGGLALITNFSKKYDNLFRNISANKPDNIGSSDDPGDSVQYLEAHDGLTTHDIVANNLKLDPVKDSNEIYSRLKLGLIGLYTAQGITFMHAGQEFGRTKEFVGTPTSADKNEMLGNFVRNSYDSSDAVNKIDWARASSGNGKNLLDYTKGLIKIRKSTDAFSLGTIEEITKSMKILGNPNMNDLTLVIGYSAQAKDGSTYYIYINGDVKAREISMTEDLTSAKVLVDNDEAGTEPVKAISGVKIEANKVTIEPLTGIIIKK